MSGSASPDWAAVTRAAAARGAVPALVVGVAGLVAGCLIGSTGLTLGALAAAWLFFAGLAAGGVAVSATIRASHGRWAVQALPFAEALAGFFPWALALLAVLVLASGLWMPGREGADAISDAWLIGRELLATAALFVAGHRYLKRSRVDVASRPTAEAIVYLLLFVGTLSLWAIDFVVHLQAGAPSTVVPAFYFIGAFLAALSCTALAVCIALPSAAAERTRHDLGKLLFAIVILWGYLLWSAYLPVWYGNLPEETSQLVARWAGGWKLATLAVLAMALAFPFFFLLPERTKRGRVTLGIAALTILGGLLVERFLLVIPALPGPGGLRAAGIMAAEALGVLGLFTVSVRARFEQAARH
jgi:hypothetical protein